MHNIEKFEEVLINKKRDKNILDEKHKKVIFLLDNIQTKEISKFNNKPFFKLGLLLIAIGIICLLIINLVPWLYVVYENKTSNIENIEILYYHNKTDIFTSDTNFTSFFSSQDSNSYLGVNSFKLNSDYITHSFILYVITVLGFVLTIIGILIIKSDFSIYKYRLLNCIFAVITAFLCVYSIFITVRFLGAEILMFYNSNFISDNISNLALIFLAPIILIIMISFLLKINITVLKLNIKHFEKKLYEKTNPNPF